MDFEDFKKGSPVQPRSRLARLTERIDFFGYNFVRDSFIPFIEFARTHSEETDAESLELAFANSLKRAFADPSVGISYSVGHIKLVPKAIDYLKRQYGVNRLPASVIHTVNLMRRVEVSRMEGTTGPERNLRIIPGSEYELLISEIFKWVKKAE